MNYRYIFIFSAAICLKISGAFAQNNPALSSLDVCLNPEKEIDSEEPSNSIWTEDEDARTLTTSTYYSDDGEIKTNQSSIPINYHNAKGKLVPIVSEMELLGENEFGALNQPYPTYYHQDGSMSLTLANKKDLIKFGKNCKINGQKIEQDYTFDVSTSNVVDAIPGVNKEIIFRENGVKYNYILNEIIDGIKNRVIFSEEIELPEGYTISNDLTRGEKTKYGWSGLLVVKDNAGNVVTTFHEPLCFDQNRKYMVASYQVREEAGKHILEIIVPSDWLNAPERQYPIVIDPIVTGPTSSWTGGQMPSCWIPAYNQDSILVTIPADVMVTELNVTASFYADPFTGAWMQDGAMYFSTDCDNTTTFTITGAPGQSAGTAYLDNFNLYNPLTCCFPESCNSQTFWLSFHLGRNFLGAGCNTTYIRYDPGTTSWPFQAVVVGRTAEHSSSEWSVPAVPTCSNDCDITGVAYVSYGVPPFTFTHPWSNDTIVQGSSVGCNNGSTSYLFNLAPPNCPNYCDTLTTSLSVPPPVITDACGNLVAAAPAESIPIKPAPSFNPVYDTLVCSEEQFIIDLGLCIPAATMQWDGNGVQGWDDQIPQTLINNTQNVTMINYTAFTFMSGCYSDTIDVPVYVQPLPIPGYTANPDPMIIGIPIDFTDASVFNASPGISWTYSYGDGDFDMLQNPTHMYPNPGEYMLCIYVENAAGCQDSICELTPVAPAEVHIPNIITPNGDQINDVLEFLYLGFYPENHLSIVDRWGITVLETNDYQNDWDASGYSDGTYFFILTLTDADKTYSGFIQVVR
mgnify:FL=1